jgi:hypothetical protein
MFCGSQVAWGCKIQITVSALPYTAKGKHKTLYTYRRTRWRSFLKLLSRLESSFLTPRTYLLMPIKDASEWQTNLIATCKSSTSTYVTILSQIWTLPVSFISHGVKLRTWHPTHQPSILSIDASLHLKYIGIMKINAERVDEFREFESEGAC